MPVASTNTSTPERFFSLDSTDSEAEDTDDASASLPEAVKDLPVPKDLQRLLSKGSFRKLKNEIPDDEESDLEEEPKPGDVKIPVDDDDSNLGNNDGEIADGETSPPPVPRRLSPSAAARSAARKV